MVISFDYNNKTGKLLFNVDDTTLFNRIREYFSVKNEGARFARQRGRFIPQRKYVITPLGSCELGLFWEIKQFLYEKQITCTIDITEKLKKVLDIGKEYQLYNDLNLKLRDYQQDVVLKAIKQGRGTCVLGTGAGKTLITATLIESYYRNSNNNNTFKCLVIVPDLGLVEQTYSEFIEYGVTFSLSKWTGSHKIDLTSNVIICNAGILQSRFEENEWVKFVDLLIVDESHKIKSSNSISKIITKINTHHKYGFTGTLPEELVDRWSIIGKFGPVVYEKTSYDLRSENYLTNVEVKVIKVEYNQIPPRITANNYRNELHFLYNSQYRNNLITTLCSRLTNNTLVLVNHIEHGQILYETLSTLSDRRVYFIRGEVEVEEREKIKREMESSTDIVCIAISAIFSTGVNIKNLHNILFVAGGKSFIRTVQSIGRGLRKHESKDKLTIIDIADQLHYGIDHSLKRQTIYQQEKIKFTEKDIKQR